MYQSSALVQALARDRSAELQRRADAVALRGDSREAVIETARKRAGWLLVDLGLRLALPRGAVNSRPERRQRSVSV